jgi:2-dehydropantoate 2-reductase
VTTFAVLGPGGVGGFVAGALSRAGESVRVVAREQTVELIERQGISVQSAILGDFIARPPVTSRLTEDVDVLFVATKAVGLEQALERIAGQPGVVVPLLNGLDHLEVLRRRFEGVAASVIRVEADRPEPGRVLQTSPGTRVDMAAHDPAIAARLPAVSDALSAAGIPAQVLDSEADVMWSKLLRLNALSATTTVSGRNIGYIRADPEWRSRLVACIEETAAVARADGASADPEATLGELDAAHASLGSSMQRDVAAGRTPELDAVQGSVLRAAARHGLECPTVAWLAGEIARMAGIDAPRAA